LTYCGNLDTICDVEWLAGNAAVPFAKPDLAFGLFVGWAMNSISFTQEIRRLSQIDPSPRIERRLTL
jgi:hypothetical protein